MTIRTVTLKIVNHKNAPLKGTVSAVCLWAEDSAFIGKEYVKSSDKKGVIKLSLHKGEWAIEVVNPKLKNEQFGVETLRITERSRHGKSLTLKSRKVTQITGKVLTKGIKNQKEIDDCSGWEQNLGRIYIGEMRGVGSYVDISERGLFKCYLPDSKRLLLDAEVYIPGAYIHSFKLQYPMKRGADKVNIPPVTVNKINPDIISIKGRITGKFRKLAYIICSSVKRDPTLTGGIMSDERGRFELYDLPEGTYKLSFWIKGELRYKSPTYTKIVEVVRKKTTKLSLPITGRKRR